MQLSIVSEPPGTLIGGINNNSFVHVVGSNLTLTCLISSTPVDNSVFKWRCSTGCLASVEMGQKISVMMQKSGMIFCAYTVNGVEYNSDPIEINVTGKFTGTYVCIE